MENSTNGNLFGKKERKKERKKHYDDAFFTAVNGDLLNNGPANNSTQMP